MVIGLIKISFLCRQLTLLLSGQGPVSNMECITFVMLKL